MKAIHLLLFATLPIVLIATLCGPSLAAAAITNTSPQSAQQLILTHQLQITPDLQNGSLEVTDRLSLPEYYQAETLDINLNSAFQLSQDGQIILPESSDRNVSHYRLKLPKQNTAQRSITLNYQGQLRSTNACDWLIQACVLLNERGLYLDSNSHWYPQTGNALHRFELNIELPTDWTSLSQGAQTNQGWREDLPQRALYLIAGRFQVYQTPATDNQPQALVYLQQDDADLAQRYLSATQRYISEYSDLLGEYPYSKFVTVESFWETGWGMPSFTLLGSRVMRLPFILHSSFPHEILHNWWGNSVYVDPQQGNWSEGLTAYLADHRRKQSQGEGNYYRRDTLQKYAAFAAAQGGDFPLSQFRGRHDRTTQAIGYGKGLMLFHMLHQRLGSEQFFAALRRFYQENRFRYAGFTELQQVFEQHGDAASNDLQLFFNQWLERSGAPHLTIDSYQLRNNAVYQQRASITLRQSFDASATKQNNSPFTLQIPLVAYFKDGSVQRKQLKMDQSVQTYELIFNQPHLLDSLAIDPDFDLLRIPDQREVPPALNTLFSRQPKTFVLSRALPDAMKATWHKAIGTLSYGQEKHVQYDDETLPETETVVLLGGGNAMLSGLLEQAGQAVRLTEIAYTLNGIHYTCGLHSLALTLQTGEQQIILLDASSPAALATLLQKLPHYGKYSYTLFDSTTGKNRARGQWPINDSPLTINFTGE